MRCPYNSFWNTIYYKLHCNSTQFVMYYKLCNYYKVQRNNAKYQVHIQKHDFNADVNQNVDRRLDRRTWSIHKPELLCNPAKISQFPACYRQGHLCITTSFFKLLSLFQKSIFCRFFVMLYRYDNEIWKKVSLCVVTD